MNLLATENFPFPLPKNPIENTNIIRSIDTDILANILAINRIVFLLLHLNMITLRRRYNTSCSSNVFCVD